MCAVVAKGPVYAATQGDREKGATLFHEKGCEFCHGPGGAGGGKGPDLSTVGKRCTKAEIEHQIQFGGKQMPAFGDSLTGEEVKQLVEFLSAKKKAPQP